MKPVRMNSVYIPALLCRVRIILLAAILSLITFLASANSYYVDAVNGNDGNDGLSTGSAWQTLAKVSIASLQPGDIVLFNRGQVFYGELRPDADGLTFDAYGTGAKPVISGLTTLSSWTDEGGGIYGSPCSSCDPQLNMVVVNGIVQGMGRYPNLTAPNGGYNTYQSFNVINSTTDMISDNNLSSAINWTGAQVVVRRNNWVLDREPVTNQSGTSITFTTSNPYPLNDNFGYFIQNDIRTLDQPGEWYYNASIGVLDMYFGTAGPSSLQVQVSTIDTLVILNHDNIVFSNLSFDGANMQGFYINNSNNASITNSSIINSGVDGMTMDYPVNGLTVQNDSISYANDCAINCLYNASTGLTIANNVVTHIGLIPGMGINYNGIVANGSNMSIAWNTVKDIGYDGICFSGSPAVVNNNFLDSFTLVLDDGGGIYTGGDQARREILNNIVLNGIGAPAGTANPVATNSVGIYADDNSHNILIQGNTVYNCSRAGVLLHNAANNSVRLNTLYANATQMQMDNDNSVYASLRNDTVTANLFFNQNSQQLTLSMQSLNNDFGLAGILDSNYYASPLDTNGIIQTAYNGTNMNYNLAYWQSAYPNFDQASHPSAENIIPYIINSVSGVNYFTNGSFTSNINGAYSDFSSSGSYSWSSGDLGAGGDYMVTSNGHVNTYFSIPGIVAGQQYRIRFTAKSTSQNTIQMRFIENGGTYFSFGATKYFSVGPAQQNYEYVFTSPATVSSAYMIATVSSLAGNMYFDNIDFEQANVSLTNPTDSLLFVYDAAPSATTVHLNELYYDAMGNSYPISIGLQSFGSAVLMENPLLISLPIGQQPAPPADSTAPTGTLLQIYPNPASTILHVVYSAVNTGTVAMSIFDAGGRRLMNEVADKQQELLTQDIAVNNLSPGIYFLELILPYGQQVTQTFIKQP